MNMLKCEFSLSIIKRIHVKINYNCAHTSISETLNINGSCIYTF